MFLLFIGPPGAGKGTQADRLAADTGFVQIATGNLLRAEIARGTPRGERCRAIERGELAPLSDVADITAEALGAVRPGAGAILDGVVRTASQAEALDVSLAARGQQLTAAVVFTVPTVELIARAAGRTVCPQCQRPFAHWAPGTLCPTCRVGVVRRPEDEPEAQVRRFAIYDESVAGIRGYYARRLMPLPILTVDGVGTMDEVTARLRGHLATVGLPAPRTAMLTPTHLVAPSTPRRARRVGR